MGRELRGAHIWGLGASLLALGCSSEPRAGVVHELATQVMEPKYAEFASASSALEQAASAFCSSIDAAHLDTTQSAWRAARARFLETESYRFGPATTVGSAAALDFWPVRPASIEKAIQEAPLPISQEYGRGLGAFAKGLPPLEYLLFRPAEGRADVLASFTPDAPLGSQRCAYAVELSRIVRDTAAELALEWSAGGGNYVRALADAGEDPRAFKTPQAALNQVVNGLIFALENLTDRRLGVPLGTKALGVPQPDETESRFSDNSLQDLSASLAGIAQVYAGQGSARGVAHLVKLRNPVLAASVAAAFDELRAKIAAIPAPLRSALSEHPESVNAAFESGRVLRRLIAVDVLSTLGVTASFSVNDGD